MTTNPGKDDENPINLRWKPKTSDEVNLFVAVEPNSWQNIELPKQGLLKRFWKKMMNKSNTGCDI